MVMIVGEGLNLTVDNNNFLPTSLVVNDFSIQWTSSLPSCAYSPLTMLPTNLRSTYQKLFHTWNVASVSISNLSPHFFTPLLTIKIRPSYPEPPHVFEPISRQEPQANPISSHMIYNGTVNKRVDIKILTNVRV